MGSDWVLGVPPRGPVGGLEVGRTWRARDQGGIPWEQFQGEWIENVGEGIQAGRTECREAKWRGEDRERQSQKRQAGWEGGVLWWSKG